MIPERTKQTIDDYVKHGWKPGGFVHSVLANDLMQSFGRADDENQAAMLSIVTYVYNEIPTCCHGSYAAVEAWLSHVRVGAVKVEWTDDETVVVGGE